MKCQVSLHAGASFPTEVPAGYAVLLPLASGHELGGESGNHAISQSLLAALASLRKPDAPTLWAGNMLTLKWGSTGSPDFPVMCMHGQPACPAANLTRRGPLCWFQHADAPGAGKDKLKEL